MLLPMVHVLPIQYSVWLIVLRSPISVQQMAMKTSNDGQQRTGSGQRILVYGEISAYGRKIIDFLVSKL